MLNKIMSKKVPYLLVMILIFLAGYLLSQGSETTDYMDNYGLNLKDSNLNLSNDSNYDKSNVNKTAKNVSTNKKTNSNYEFEGVCTYVVDGDTIDVENMGRIRFVGVNTPERGESGYKIAKEYVKEKCLGKTVYLDVDDKKNKDKYGRTLAVIYTNDGQNLNQLLLKNDYAEVMYIPPSEFYPYDWQ